MKWKRVFCFCDWKKKINQTFKIFEISFSQLFFIHSFFIFFFESFSIFFCILKDGVTPLFVAAQNGHEQTVQILLEKGKPNVDLADEVIFIDLISFSFLFLFFSLFSLFTFFVIRRMEELLFILLLVKDMNKLFKFYWKKENQMLILQMRLFLLIWFLFLFFFFFFHFFHFSLFL